MGKRQANRRNKPNYGSIVGMLTAAVLCIQTLAAQPFPAIQFARLNTAKGMPTNLITTAFKDSRGLVWFGSETSGLLRYDGRNLKSFQEDNRKGMELGQGYTGAVCEDRSGWLWVSTANGLHHFDPVSEQLETYHHNETDTASLAADDKPRPFVDSRGRIWVSSSGGLQRFNPVKKSFTSYTITPPANPGLQLLAKSVGMMMEDQEQRLWAAGPYGLYLVDTIAAAVQLYPSGIYSFVSGILEDSNRKLWVSFWGGGIKLFDPASGKYTDVTKPSGIALYINKWVDENNKEWICYAENYTFRILDSSSRQIATYATAAAGDNPLRGHEITCIYRDDEQRLWICTNAGVFIADRKRQLFSNHLLYQDIYTDLNHHFGEPRSLLIRDNEYYLSTWYAGKLYRYNKNWQLLEIKKSIPPGAAAASSGRINTMQQDARGQTWFGTDSGLVKQSVNRFKVFLPRDSFSLVEDRYAARNILPRPDGLSWVRFYRRGVYTFDTASGQFLKNYRAQYNGQALCMEYDKNGKLWLGTSQGLYYYQPAIDSFVQLPIYPPEKTGHRQYNNILHFYFDKDNTCWVGTFNGLVKINLQNRATEFIINPLKPHYYTVWRILADSLDNLWMLSNTALISYNKHLKSFRYFTEDNGLPENFTGFPGVFSWLNDSIMAVGSTGVITTFNPYRVATAAKAVPLLFTDISIDGKRQAIIGRSAAIVAGPGVHIISIHFAYLNFTAPQQNKLYYRVSAAPNDAWMETNDGEVTLLNLPPGHYLLLVKAVANGDLVHASERALDIQVQPYWFQTILFKTLLAAVLGFILFLLIRWRIKVVRQAAFIRQRIAETEMAALKAQMNPHFIFNCISCIDGLIQDDDKYHATVYLNKFAKLIRNVLDSSRENTIELYRDIETLQLYLELEQLRSEDKYRTGIEIAAELKGLDYQVPPLVIQPFVENAIHHGLRNRKGNDGVLLIRIVRLDEAICYTIEDNGIGRKAAGLLHSHHQGSYGIQMSMERIRLFNEEAQASVSVEDLYDGDHPAGTRVTVKLTIK